MPARAPLLCQILEARLPDLVGLEGEPSECEASELHGLRLHAAECPACADDLRAYRTTVQLLRALPRREAPDGFLAWVTAHCLA